VGDVEEPEQVCADERAEPTTCKYLVTGDGHVR
jgi:hypothetical protein